MPRHSTVQFRDVVGFPGYRVGDDGTVWTCLLSGKKLTRGDVWRLMCPSLVFGGYPAVTLCSINGKFNRKIHHIVLEAFIGPRPKGREACHNNGVRTDNRPSNLRWDSRYSNAQDKISHGTVLRGEDAPRAILTEEQVLEIRRLYSGKSITKAKLSRKFGMSASCIRSIIDRVNWKHI